MKWIIGDVHGAFYTLMGLLERIQPCAEDELFFLGDYINKGAHSWEVLQSMMHRLNAICLMGNHDLRLLYRVRDLNELPSWLPSSQRSEVIAWLSQRPWAHYEASHQALMLHAGAPPGHSKEDIMAIADWAQRQVHDPQWLQQCLQAPWSDPRQQAAWSLLHIRHVDALHAPDFTNVLAPPMPDLIPWFSLWQPDPLTRIYFGHWAHLRAEWQGPAFCALDGGVAYGGHLVAYNLERGEWIRERQHERDQA